MFLTLNLIGVSTYVYRWTLC